MPCYFFCGSTKNDLLIAQPFSEEFVPLDIVRIQCETVFGIKASKLSVTGDAQGLFHATGFHSIYGITNAPTQGEGVIKVSQLTKLNAFLSAPTILEKKRLFLSHGKNFVREYLEKTQVNQTTLRVLEPIILYCEQQYELASHAPLYKRKKSRGETRDVFIDTLKNLGRNTSTLLLAAMGIKKLIDNDNLTEEALYKILTPINELTDSQPQSLNATVLGSNPLLTCEEVITNTLRLLTSPPPIHQSRKFLSTHV